MTPFLVPSGWWILGVIGEESFIDRVQRLATCCLELELGGCFDEMVWLTLVFATGLGGGCHGDFEFFFVMAAARAVVRRTISRLVSFPAIFVP